MEEHTEDTNPFKILRNKIKIEGQINQNVRELFIDQLSSLRKVKKNAKYNEDMQAMSSSKIRSKSLSVVEKTLQREEDIIGKNMHL